LFYEVSAKPDDRAALSEAAAVRLRLEQVEALRRLCLSLGR